MIDKVKVINFLQDFGCARLKQLQVLFGDKDSNFGLFGFAPILYFKWEFCK